MDALLGPGCVVSIQNSKSRFMKGLDVANGRWADVNARSTLRGRLCLSRGNPMGHAAHTGEGAVCVLASPTREG